jgi:hypothetical protein
MLKRRAGQGLRIVVSLRAPATGEVYGAKLSYHGGVISSKKSLMLWCGDAGQRDCPGIAAEVAGAAPLRGFGVFLLVCPGAYAPGYSMAARRAWRRLITMIVGPTLEELTIDCGDRRNHLHLMR